jgi:hypothetical protein
MRKARDWYFLEFNPQSVDDINAALFGEHSGYLRMVWSYWEMAAALVNHGAVNVTLFSDTNTEHISTFAKVQPFLREMRVGFGPQFAANLEKLIDAMPNGRERVAATQERIKKVRERVAARGKESA